MIIIIIIIIINTIIYYTIISTVKVTKHWEPWKFAAQIINGHLPLQ